MLLRDVEYVRPQSVEEAIAALAGHEGARALAYLRGRVAYAHHELDRASAEFAAVDRNSRLYPGAAYFRGLVAARRKSWQEAKSAVCEIAGTYVSKVWPWICPGS